MSGLPAQVGVSEGLFGRLIAFRRELHEQPELAWEEERTAERIEAELTRLSLEHRLGERLERRRIAGTGVVADFRGGDPSLPRIALRADTDALPVAEETGLPFASRVPGVMHACGHDGHSAMLLGAAELLARDAPPGPVRLIWQPAEERGDGAPKLIAAGVLVGVAAIFGGHVDRRFPAGVLVVTDGAVGASTDEFVLRIHGKQGHGARPHTAVDAVLVGSRVVAALQDIVSREVDPGASAVVSVGSFHAGSAPNIIAGLATLEGTLRAMDPGVREHLRAALRRVAEGVALAHGARVELEVVPGTPPVVNDPASTATARRAAVEVVGHARVKRLATANMGGEDFACYLERTPGCYVRFGARPTTGEAQPAHSARFDIDEEAIAVGAAWFDRVARSSLSVS